MNYDIKSWTRDELVNCLEHSGYNCDDLLEVKYSHTSVTDPNCLVFSVGYEDMEHMGEIAYGKVYVSIKDGVIQADY